MRIPGGAAAYLTARQAGRRKARGREGKRGVREGTRHGGMNATSARGGGVARHAPADIVRDMAVPQLLHHPLDLPRREIKLEADRRVGSRLRRLREKVYPLKLGDEVLYHGEVRLRARDRCSAPADALHPAQRVEAVLHAELQGKEVEGERERERWGWRGRARASEREGESARDDAPKGDSRGRARVSVREHAKGQIAKERSRDG